MGQYDRLVNDRQANPARQKKIQEITDRYLLNIGKTRQYKRDMDAYHNAPSFAESRRLDYEMQNRQYSRNTYMGLSTGG